jgi:hypothetical protein
MTSDGSPPPLVPLAPLDPSAPQPELDANGLVIRRPPDDGRIFYDDPMFRNYQWIAMLDPVELAEGGFSTGEPTPGSHPGRRPWGCALARTRLQVP